MSLPDDLDIPVPCTKCGGTFTLRGLILGAERGPARSLKVVASHTPCCGDTEELWLRTGFVSRGYTYAAGQPHFADMETYRLPSLVVQWNPGAVVVTLGDQSLVVPLG